MWVVYLVFMTIIGLFCRELYRKIMFDAIPEKSVHGEIIESNETDILYFTPSRLRGVQPARTFILIFMIVILCFKKAGWLNAGNPDKKAPFFAREPGSKPWSGI